ncbi:helix-turn-helix transcriptional regulator [Aliiroseovarius sp. 2305UL8-7]|uniref:helix-turn-helix transcriptional regulator n=1 Tax=Aliiroseovarius conchicola TaxID=3121637 RepID=UPI0035282087
MLVGFDDGPASATDHRRTETLREILRQSALGQYQSRLDKRLVVIQAPAGSGKSTILGQIQGLLTDKELPHMIVVIGDDNGDDAFLLRFFKAIHSFAGNSALSIGTFGMDSNRLTEQIVRAAQELTSPLYVLIDDFHLIKSQVTIRLLTRLVYLNDTVPLRLVIASRNDCGIPVSNLRLEGQMLELGPNELRFSKAEADRLREAWQVDIDTDQWQKFHHKVDGWPVAIRLALVLLKENRMNVEGLLNFSGTQREMADYLSEMLLGGLSQGDQKLLFKAAAFDSLQPDLLHAVLGDDQAGRLMKLVEQLALPQNAGGEQVGVRLHSIVLDYLTERAIRADIDLYEPQKRATEFLASQGKWRRSINYALKAGDLRLAAEVSEQAGGWRLIYRGEQGTAQQFHELAGLDRLELARFPRTALGLAIASAKRGEIEYAVDLLRFSKRAAAGDDLSAQGEFRLIEALLSLYRDDLIPEDVVAQLENSLMQVPNIDLVQVALTQNLLCFASLQNGVFDAAIGFGRQAAASFRSANSNFGAAHLPLHIGQSEFFLGRFAAAQTTLARHLSYCEATLGPLADLTLMTKALMVETEVENSCDVSHGPFIEMALTRLGESDTWFDPLAALVLSGARLAFVERNIARAETVFSIAEDIAQARGYHRLFDLVALLRIEGLSISGQLDEARFLIDELRGSRKGSAANSLDRAVTIRGVPFEALEADLDLRSGDLTGTGAHLEALKDRQSGAINTPRKIRMEILNTLLLQETGEQALAERRLERLVLTNPVDCYRMPFRQIGQRIAPLVSSVLGRADRDSLVHRRLSRVGEVMFESALSGDETTGEVIHLTKSETKVLRFLEQGKSNKEIGRELDVSDNTVKYHVANIFKKLRVSTRTAAAMRARVVRLSEG